MKRYIGGCLCGAVRYAIDSEPLPGRSFLCHCVDCQRQTGTAFTALMGFPSEDVAVTGTMTTFTMPGGQSSEPMHRRFCPRCGSPIIIEKDGTGRTLIMAGTLDDKALFKPEVSLFCDSAPAWVMMPANCRNLPRSFT